MPPHFRLVVLLCITMRCTSFVPGSTPHGIQPPRHIMAAKHVAKPKRSRSDSSGSGGFGGDKSASSELKQEVACLRSELADAVQIIAELRAENARLRLLPEPASPPRLQSSGRFPRGLRQVSSQPLVFTIDDFVDAAMCEALLSPDSSTDEQAAFAALVAGELFAGQWGVNDRQRFNNASSSDRNNDASALVSYPSGLHVDTNNEATRRSVTMILYLTDVSPACGGATCFPIADAPDNDSAVLSAKALLKEGVTHTRGAVTAGGTVPAFLHEAAAMLEARHSVDDGAASGGGGLRIQPRAGRLCVFFSRTADGEVDPRSWHGGERLRPNIPDGPPASAPPALSAAEGSGSEVSGAVLSAVEGRGGSEEKGGGGGAAAVTEKRILTLFKEVHYGAGAGNVLAWDGQEANLGAFLAPQVSKQRQY
mmetsp:Transcript_68789/g.138293  ORF Transcript_68789/g.138293 Transcript_68789/m.138293 type:complete len:423 (-) Transcript_68789:17-1285(-)